jgi:hypothetical protein
MAALIVSAFSSTNCEKTFQGFDIWGAAAISVTDSNGVPVSGLKPAAFTVALVFSNTTSPVKAVHEHPVAKGFYWLEIEADYLWLETDATDFSWVGIAVDAAKQGRGQVMTRLEPNLISTN